MSKLVAQIKCRKVSRLLINHFQGGVVYYAEIYKINCAEKWLYLLTPEYKSLEVFYEEMNDFFSHNNIEIQSKI